MSRSNIEGILDIYNKCKHDEFNGMVFIKFKSPEKREEAMEAAPITQSPTPNRTL